MINIYLGDIAALVILVVVGIIVYKATMFYAKKD